MKTNVFALALLGALSTTSIALAQDDFDNEDPEQDPRVTTTAEDLQSGLPCFKLQQPTDFCAIVGQPIVNYAHPVFNVIDLNGAWAGPGGEIPYIYLYGDPQYSAGYTVAVDMSLLNRPDGFGYVVDASTILVVFPDDQEYTGKLDASGTVIRWSNNTVWTKR